MMHLIKQGLFHKSWNSFNEQKITDFLKNDEISATSEDLLD